MTRARSLSWKALGAGLDRRGRCHQFSVLVDMVWFAPSGGGCAEMRQLPDSHTDKRWRKVGKIADHRADGAEQALTYAQNSMEQIPV